MKSIIITAVLFAITNKGNAQLPKCIIQKISVGYDYSQILVALYENDTCYVLKNIKWDPATTTKHQVMMMNIEWRKPEYVQPEVYNKDCKPLKLIRNKDLLYTSKIYRWEELKHLIEQSIIAANQIKAQLPECLIQKVAAIGGNFSLIKTALYKNDTCYVIERRTVIDRRDPGKISRYEIFLRNKPVKLEVYNKECKSFFPQNQDLIYTSKIYTREEIKHLIKN
jgi:hypothetical protein